jgi:C-terminal processing protease CtpA/Prc
VKSLLLSRFTIIFNPITQKVYFKPRKSLKKAFKFDKSGMIIYAFGPNLNDYVVQGIIPNSAAELAGIQVGDKIKRVGIVSTNFMKLSDLLLKFQKKAGKKIKLKIQRGEDIIHKRLILKDLL